MSGRISRKMQGMSRFIRKTSMIWSTTSMSRTIVRTGLVRSRKQRRNLRKKRKTRRRMRLMVITKGVPVVALWLVQVKNRSSSHLRRTRRVRACPQDLPLSKPEGRLKKALRMRPLLNLALWSMEMWARTRIWLRRPWLTSSLSRLWRSSLRDSRRTAMKQWCYMLKS